MNIYDILSDRTDVAISRAERQYYDYGNDVPPSKRCPATRLFELIKVLKEYI